MPPLVGVIMGSQSDWETMSHAAQTLETLGVPFETRVVSAHRTPDLLFEYAASAEGRGLEVIIAGAGGAAHLPGMAAAKTHLPVLGVPVESKALNGMDSLLSIVQMPAGIPVGTLAIGRAGAINAALLAAAILANKHSRFRDALLAFRRQQTQAVLDHPDPREGGDGVTTIGILGAGQLGRMLAFAGYPLGLRFVFLDPAAEAPAAQLAERIAGGFEDPDALQRFAAAVEVVTYEFENVPVQSARWLEQRHPVYPPPAALEAAQDRVAEKRFFRAAGLGTAPFEAVDSRGALAEAVARLGLPAILKTRRFGYDGKGQLLLRQPDDVPRAWETLGGVPLIVEGFVAFSRELSLLAVRARGGETAFYPLVENHHRDGMLRQSLAPAPGLTPDLQQEAESHGRRMLDALGYVGVLAVEFFQVDGPPGRRLLASEMAPRVHNSGHWTIEGAATSQFANHLRAILGWPLGSTATPRPVAMLNLIGHIPDLATLLSQPGVHVHLYGKKPRAGRKLGHLTLVADDAAQLQSLVSRVRALVPSLG